MWQQKFFEDIDEVESLLMPLEIESEKSLESNCDISHKLRKLRKLLINDETYNIKFLRQMAIVYSML